jgi:hypothetical protein
MSSAASGVDYKFTTKVEILDGGNGANEPVVLETWELYGCYLSGADYGALNYSENAPVSITMTIVYDNANQSPVGVGVATKLGRTIAGSVSAAGI